MSDFVAITCPFCGGMDFDKIGLKIHLESGHCDEYNDTPRYTRFPVADPKPCPECGGRGKVSIMGDIPCPRCGETVKDSLSVHPATDGGKEGT